MLMHEKISATSEQSSPERASVFQSLDKVNPNPYSRGEYIRRFFWGIVHATLFRFSPPRMHGWRRFLLRCFGAKIGPHSGLRPAAKIFHPWLFEIGDWSMLAGGVVSSVLTGALLDPVGWHGVFGLYALPGVLLGHRRPFPGNDRIDMLPDVATQHGARTLRERIGYDHGFPQLRGLHTHRRPRAVEDGPYVGGQKADEKRIGHGNRRQCHRQRRLEGRVHN